MKFKIVKDAELFNTSKVFSLTGNQPIIINKFIIPPPKQQALFDNKTMKKIYKQEV